MPVKKKKNKVYAVAIGHQPGIYNSWEECKLQTHGFKKAKYKAFLSLDEAKDYMRKNSLHSNYTSNSTNETLTSIFKSFKSDPWSKEEELDFMKNCGYGKSMEQISKISNRDILSLKNKMNSMMNQMAREGTNINDICRSFNRHKSFVMKVISNQTTTKKPPKVVKSTIKPLLNTILEEQNAMKQEIKAIHSKLDELLTMMQAAYEFEGE